MSLPIDQPLAPMLAKSVPAVPAGDFGYEPKWDGFRCLIFKDGANVSLDSRSQKPLTRYFPELAAQVAASALPDRCVLDGEIVMPIGDRLEFDVLNNRIHPAASRIELLSKQTPASYVAFDLLAHGDESYLDEPFSSRRARLEDVMAPVSAPLYLTALTDDVARATDWFARFEGAGLDGVVAKPLAAPYAPGKRTMLKIKHARTADVVVAGYRLHKKSTPDNPLLGSMLVGLYDDAGVLQYVGGCAAFSTTERAELVRRLAELTVDLDGHPWGGGGEGDRRPETDHRWSSGKDTSFVPLQPVLVAEIAYDQLQGNRLRHAGRLERWRPDREPESCTYDQLEVPVSYDLSDVLLGR